MLGGCKKNGKMNLGRGIFLGNSYLILGLIIKMLRIFLWDNAHFVAPLLEWEIPCLTTPPALRATSSFDTKRRTYLIHIQ
jgi:hypothetical protein